MNEIVDPFVAREPPAPDALGAKFGSTDPLAYPSLHGVEVHRLAVRLWEPCDCFLQRNQVNQHLQQSNARDTTLSIDCTIFLLAGQNWLRAALLVVSGQRVRN
jgi:hypothetical protein